VVPALPPRRQQLYRPEFFVGLDKPRDALSSTRAELAHRPGGRLRKIPLAKNRFLLECLHNTLRCMNFCPTSRLSPFIGFAALSLFVGWAAMAQ
jgi:hypothetical protein